MDESTIKDKVDEYAKWDNLIKEAKKEIDKLKGEFQKLAVEAMSNKKVKQVEFWGSQNTKVAVTTSETLKLVSYQFLLKALGEEPLVDFVKIEPQYKLSEPFKRWMTALFQGNYVEQSVDEVITQISDDEKTRKTLKKKLKGNWGKDVENLKVIAGLNNRDAEYFAYFYQEAKNFSDIARLLEVAGHERGSEGFNKTLEAIRHAVVVEEGIKVGLECEEAV